MLLLTAIATMGLGTGTARAGKPKDSDTVMLNGDGRKLTRNCEGKSYVIGGEGNTITLKGECATVNLAGEKNKVDVETVANIMISGENNTLTWHKGKDGKPPSVMKSGDDNQVVQAK